jgi:lysyl-tRNA synthetase class 2
MQSQHLSEQEIIRREKLQELLNYGIDPYPAPLYPVNNYSTEIKGSFSDDNKDAFSEVCLAGRVMSVRDMGKASFAVYRFMYEKMTWQKEKTPHCMIWFGKSF